MRLVHKLYYKENGKWVEKTTVREIDESEVPESLKGLPVTLMAASFVSLAFFGFAGIVENLFA